MDYIHILDNNIFRILCSSEKGIAIKRLYKSISNFSFLQDKINIAIKLTPFSILEAIGIVPPKMYNLSLPTEIIQLKDATQIANYLSSKALGFYLESEVISLGMINKKALEQENYVTTEAKDIYNKLVLSIFNETGFIEYLQKQLVMDYLIKYDYPNEIDEIMMPFFGAQLFMNDEISSNISKFRLAKKLSNMYYNLIQHDRNVHKAFLNTLQKSMNIDKHQDYLDCDLIHFACLGILINDERFPVICYTLDKPEIIIQRIEIYKSTIELFKYSLEKSNPNQINLPPINQAEGMFAFCSKEGDVYSMIEIRTIGNYI